MSSPALIIPERIEEVPALEGSVLVPLVHKEIAGSTEDLRIVEHPLVVQEGLDLPSTGPSDTPVQVETVDTSINKEAASTEECPNVVDSGETILEPLVQSSEVKDQLPLESTSQLDAEGDPSNTFASELLAVSEPSTAMYGAGAAIDDLT
ncbi:hypothetical protein MRB53_026009 [Persea americana]|uniref:Uncharacterized protein n=1 Tax=Persea americana TaxID=3435 RepID=A0ACC2LHN0_PERAE|nr:hypothetical protein MRB53_026009 [Persea americana]